MKNPYQDNLNSYKEDLAIRYMPAVKSMAFRLKERLPSSVDFNDLISVGLEELVKLAKRYDPKKNDNFWGYAKQRVYGSMLDFLRSLDIISRNNRKIIKDIDKIIDDYQSIYNEEPSNEYIAKKLGLDKEKVKEVRNSLEIYSLMPINEQINYFSDVSKEIEKDELINSIKKVLSKLSKVEQLVIQLYYFEELSLKEVAEVLEISESRVSQIHRKVIRKLREELIDG